MALISRLFVLKQGHMMLLYRIATPASLSLLIIASCYAQDVVPLGKPTIRRERRESVQQWIRPSLVQVFLIKRVEITALEIPAASKKELSEILDAFSAKQQQALRDIEAASRLDGQARDLFRKTSTAEAQDAVRKANEDLTKWARGRLSSESRKSLIPIIVATMGGNNSLTTDIVAEHLNLSDDQRKKVAKLVSDETRFLETLSNRLPHDGPIKPNSEANNMFASFAARLYQILDAEQITTYLRVTRAISADEGILEFLERMPKDTRSQLLQKSNRLFEVVKDQILTKAVQVEGDVFGQCHGPR